MEDNAKEFARAIDTVNKFLDCGAIVFVKVKGNEKLVRLEQIDMCAPLSCRFKDSDKS